MSTRAEGLFAKLQNYQELASLVGTAEDSDFDCKEWRGYDANRGSISKAACAFANATGGVIVIGVKAVGRDKEPDLVTELCPVENPEAVKSIALDIILKAIDPGVPGVVAVTIADPVKVSSGFVLIFVPESLGTPQRSRVDSRFHVRIASGTVPMEMFQIADRFGRRPQPRLKVSLSGFSMDDSPFMTGRWRSFSVVVTNEGRGVAQYPGLFLKLDVACQKAPYDPPIWLESPSRENWTSFRGGANDVVYPGESRAVVKYHQRGILREKELTFPPIGITARIVCLDMAEMESVLLVDGADVSI